MKFGTIALNSIFGEGIDIKQYLAQIQDKEKNHLEVLKNTLGDTAFTDETWVWRSKILANWLEFAGIVQRKSGKIIASQQPNLFEPQ